MSTDFQPVQTTRMGEVSVTRFATKNGPHFQFTASTRKDSNQKDMFQAMQFSKADMVAMATAMMECAADMRDPE